MSGLRLTVARKLATYNLDVAGLQEVRWDKGGAVRRGHYIFFFIIRTQDEVTGTNADNSSLDRGGTFHIFWINLNKILFRKETKRRSK